MTIEVVNKSCDVLVVGGGIAGLMAAIRASELGAKVIVADKANTVRSGAGGVGNDHFMCYIPEVHGTDFEGMVEEFRRSAIGGVGRNRDFVRTWFEKSFDIVKLWDSWGIPMKYNGKWEFAGHGLPGRRLNRLKYSGQNQKPVLTREAIKRGARITNRVMVFDLFSDGRIIGAAGIDIRDARLIVFQAKSVVLGTGFLMRLYPSPTPGWMFNLTHPPNLTGDGRAMAYRAGAELVNMEVLYRHIGPRYFSRSGQATWVGVLRDPQGNAIGPFVTKPDRRYGDPVAEVYRTMFEDYANSGRGPVYMDCRGISDEDLKYMMYWLKNEGNTAIINHFKEEGIDLRKNPIEFTSYEIRIMGGVYCNEKAETTVKGLYGAGDEFTRGISGAAIFGWIAGDSAAKYSDQVEHAAPVEMAAKVEAKKAFINEILSRKDGAGWKEVNIALQQVMNDYAGLVRSETMLSAGHSHLSRLKQKAYTTMVAANQHELMHCLEVLNLLDIGELVFIAANERKETRGRHVRTDYPFTNPLLDKMLLIKNAEGKPVAEWR